MAQARKQKSEIRPSSRIATESRIFSELGCDAATYEFDVPAGIFDLKRFRSQTGLTANDRTWSTVFYAQKRSTGYHVHFDGRVGNKGEVTLNLSYYGTSIVAPKASNGPSAENAMKWIGSFFKTPKGPALVYGRFSKPTSSWRGRFNLPFKVTMTGSNAEMEIDGVSLTPSKNPYLVIHGWLNRHEKRLSVSIVRLRSVDFSTFNVEKEVPSHNESLQLFIEEVK